MQTKASVKYFCFSWKMRFWMPWPFLAKEWSAWLLAAFFAFVKWCIFYCVHWSIDQNVFPILYLRKCQKIKKLKKNNSRHKTKTVLSTSAVTDFLFFLASCCGHIFSQVMHCVVSTIEGINKKWKWLIEKHVEGGKKYKRKEKMRVQ